MSDANDFESDSAAIGPDANGSPGVCGRAAPVIDGLLTARRAAELVNRTCGTLHNWERRGLLRPVRIGRGIYYRASDIEALAERGAPTPASLAVSASDPVSGALKAGADGAPAISANQSAPAL